MNSAKKHQAALVWHALDLAVESESCEAVEYALMEAGALGTETRQSDDELLEITAYFESLPDRERVRAELFEALRIYSLPSSSVRDMDVREVADQDWLGEWKKAWHPVEIGQHFIIAPPWAAVPDTSDRIVIRIEPGMAFGTGTHETTRLCLLAIEKHFEGGSLVDVGTGTGILAIAAAKLLPEARIEAYDTEAKAIAIARENAQLNDVSSQIVFRVGTVDQSLSASADCVCANLTAEAISSLLPSLLRVTCGRLILSGILNSQTETIVGRLQELGVIDQCEITASGDWACIVI